MVRMVPPRVPLRPASDPVPHGESTVYAALRDSLGPDYVVYGWVSVLDRRPRRRLAERELDFVVAHPRRGFIVLEVKGGRVSLRNGLWYSRNREGEVEIDDPFRKARSGSHLLNDHLRNRLHPARQTVPFGHGVVLPETADGPRMNAEERALLILEGDLARIGERVGAIFERWGSGERPDLPGGWIEKFEGLLPLSAEIEDRLGARIRQDLPRMVRLTEEQFRLLDSLQDNPRVLITGAAGTGKTMLALEKARRLAAAGARTLLTCFNRPLADFLAERSAGIEHLVVHNFHQLCHRWAARNGFKGPDPDSPAVRDVTSGKSLDREYFDVTLPQAFLAALSAFPDDRFDAIVVDEGQDFSRTMQRATRAALRFPRRGMLFIFQDPGQGLFAGREGWTAGSLPRFHLGENMRNSRRIHTLLKHLGPHDDSRSIGADGTDVEFIEAADVAAAAERIEERVRRLTVDDGVALGQIAVLTTRKEEIAVLAPDRRLRGFDVTQDPFDRPGRLYLDRISRFKGLERDVVILTRLGDPPPYNRPQSLLYVGASRARAHLIVVDSAEVLARFRP